jgi:Kelch motif
MMPRMKSLFIAIVLMTPLFISGCNLKKTAAGPSGGTGPVGGPYTIGGTVSGLANGSTGLVLKNNATDALTISGNGAFTFKTTIVKGQAYSVSVTTPPSNPAENCTVVNGNGLATSNVTTVQVACTVGTGNIIAGQVTGLLGTGLVLQDNGGDNLAVKANGGFNFATTVATGATYNVTVLAQPSNPTQTCTVANGAGTASGNVGSIVVTCSSGTLSLGGSVSGLAGNGLVLANTDGDTVSISGNGSFTFPILLVSGTTYNVTIQSQPTGPAQICTIGNNTGTATANVSNIQIVCPAVFHTIGGQVVGLYVPTGQNSNMVIQNNGGDNLPIIGDGAFTFVTQIANGSAYDVSIFVQPNSQPQECITWGWNGVALSNVTDITIDCGHNDWTWMDGPNKSNSDAIVTTPPVDHTKQDNDTPGGSKYATGWTDSAGNLWLFTGSSHAVGKPNIGQFFGEMWEYVGTPIYAGSLNNYWTLVPQPGAFPTPRWGAVSWTDAAGQLWLFGGQDGQPGNFLNDLWSYNPATNVWTAFPSGPTVNGVYGTKGTAGANNFPGARWGATAKIDSNGAVWLFGGFGFDVTSATPGLLNDLWKYSGGQWTWVSGSNTTGPSGVYGQLSTSAPTNVPGGRQASVSWIDNSGNFWVFGGYDLSPTNQPNAFNDLWEFSGGQWTWVSGANFVNQTATYGSQGVSAATNVPGARWAAATWSDSHGDMWLFGGFGYDATGNGTLGDLWEYKGGQWIWVKGPSSVSQTGVYGIQPNPFVWPHVINYPGTRWGAAYWAAPNGFWMWGGEGFDATSGVGDSLLNDLWRYLPFP